MNQQDIQKLVEIRTILLNDFRSRQDWQSNRNAIMREIEHIELLEKAIKKIDKILEGHVTFS